MNDASSPRHELRFRSLLRPGRVFAFPCDARGLVDLDRLSERARNDYLYARAMVGRELAAPRVEPMSSQPARVMPCWLAPA